MWQLAPSFAAPSHQYGGICHPARPLHPVGLKWRVPCNQDGKYREQRDRALPLEPANRLVARSHTGEAIAGQDEAASTFLRLLRAGLAAGCAPSKNIVMN